MGVYETLMPDVMAPEAHQNNHSYVRELSGLTFDSLHKNLSSWSVTRRTAKKTVKVGGWVLARGWALAWDNTVTRLKFTVYVCIDSFIRNTCSE